MKEGGIGVLKAGQMWRLSMKKSKLTQVRLNRRATFDRRIEVSTPFLFFSLTRNEEKKTGLQIG